MSLRASVPLALAALIAGLIALERPAAAAARPCSFRLSLQALTDPTGTELTLVVSSKTCDPPKKLGRVEIKVFSRGGAPRGVKTIRNLAAPGGQAAVALGKLGRGQRLKVGVRFGRYALSGRTKVLRRPDLVIARLTVPRSVLVGKPFSVTAQVGEINRDAGASTLVSVSAPSGVLASVRVRVRAGGRTPVRLPVTLSELGSSTLTLRIGTSVPSEFNVSNDERSAAVEVAEFELARSEVLVPAAAGYGAQYNQNVYAAISRDAGVTDANVTDMEQKVAALEPGLARVFFDPPAFSDPDLMQSFVRTVQLAQRSAAAINVTWTGGGEDSPDLAMGRFTNVLVDLVKNRGITKLRWVTIDNEPNAGRITMDKYERLYRVLDADLAKAGVRRQIRFMGGDLVGQVSRLGQTQQEWFTFLATRMADVLDAYSIHVYWDYWDTAKLVRRLTDVRAIYDALPADGKKPLYVSEYGVRGLRMLGGVAYPEPGVYADGTPLEPTNINAFQHAWFDLLAARLGYAGTVKWDSYFGRYGKTPQDYSMIGSPLDGWPLRPVYQVTRLLTLTVRPGWKVVGVDSVPGTRVLAGYAGPGGQLTVAGLDTAGGTLNAVSDTQDSYSIGGLPPNTSFQLLYWNLSGDGLISSGGAVRTDAAGVLTVTAPLQSVFAVTNLPVP